MNIPLLVKCTKEYYFLLFKSLQVVYICTDFVFMFMYVQMCKCSGNIKQSIKVPLTIIEFKPIY